MIDGDQIKKPHLYRLCYFDERLGCVIRIYSTKKILLKEKLTEKQNEKFNDNIYPDTKARFWILQENISYTKEEIWSDVWNTIERPEELDALLEPEKPTELERNFKYRREI